MCLDKYEEGSGYTHSSYLSVIVLQYKLLVYVSQKKHVTTVRIDASFSYTVSGSALPLHAIDINVTMLADKSSYSVSYWYNWLYICSLFIYGDAVEV